MWLINNTRTQTRNDPTVSLASFCFLRLCCQPARGEKDVPEISGLESGAVLHGEYSGVSHSVV